MARKRGRPPRRDPHPCAKTTPEVRRAIQASEEKNTVLAKRYGVNRKTIAIWKARESTSDERMGPKNPGSRVLTRDEQAIILDYRWRTRLPLNVCHDRLRRLMPKLSRYSLYRCLNHWGLSRIRATEPAPFLTSAALRGPYCFEITADKIVFPNEALSVVVRVLLAVEEVTKFVYAEAIEGTPENAAAFLARLVAKFPQRINVVRTDVTQMFTDWPGMYGEDMAPISPHPFAVVCRANGIFHTRTAPWSPGPPPMPRRRPTDVEIR